MRAVTVEESRDSARLLYTALLEFRMSQSAVAQEVDIREELDGFLKQTVRLPEIVRRRIAYTVKEARDQGVLVGEVKLLRLAQTPFGVRGVILYWASRLTATLDRANGAPLLREALEKRMRDSCETGSVPPRKSRVTEVLAARTS
jgi:hypothetical protein